MKTLRHYLMTLALLALPTTTPAAEDHTHHSTTTPVATAAPAASGTVSSKKYPAPTVAEIQAAFPDLGGMAMDDMGAQSYGKFLLDRLEAQDADAGTALLWDAQAYWGRDFDKLWLTSEGERLHGATEHTRSELYWSHAVAPWWDTTLGLRQDGGGGNDRTWLGLGVQGLAPYFFEVKATAYLGESGRSALRLEAEYEALLTNRLILQPRLELNAYGEDDAPNGVGRGVSDSELGLRLRYEIRREFAPYAGLEWSRRYGRSADFARAAGERTGEARAVAGLRFWF